MDAPARIFGVGISDDQPVAAHKVDGMVIQYELYSMASLVASRGKVVALKVCCDVYHSIHICGWCLLWQYQYQVCTAVRDSCFMLSIPKCQM